VPLATLLDWLARRPKGLAVNYDGRQRTVHALVFALLLLFVPSVLIRVLTLLDLARIDVSRYVAFAAVAPILAAVVVCALYTTRIAKVAYIGLICLTLHLTGERCLFQSLNGSLPVFVCEPNYRGFREDVAFVNRECHGDQPIFVQSEFVENAWLARQRDNRLLRDYLLCTVNSLHVIDRSPPERLLVPIRNVGTLAMYRDAILQNGGCFIITSPVPTNLHGLETRIAKVLSSGRSESSAALIKIKAVHDRVLQVATSLR